jgi:hypothetical protein
MLMPKRVKYRKQQEAEQKAMQKVEHWLFLVNTALKH